ncbi:phage gene 29 protein family protein [Mycobacterium kansasii]
MIAQTIPPDFKEFTKGFPTRDNCDLSDPYQMFLWMFVALPYVKGGPLIMPIDYYQFVSRRLHDLGAMLQCPSCGHANAPTLKYQAPLATDPNWMTSPGKWVPVDTPDNDVRPPAAKAADQLMTQQQAELLKELLGRLTPEQRKALIDSENES